MDISRVPSALLSERLDAEFYRPEFLDNDQHLRQLGVCEPLSAAADDIQLGYTGPTEEYYCAPGSPGAYYLSSKNIVDGCVDLTDATDRVSLAAHNGPLRKTQVRAGDLLISRTGTVGKCALLFDAENNYNIAAHLIALRINGEFDSPFLGAFFNSVYGTRQSVRLQRGTIIHGLSVYDVPLMLVPRFSQDVQRHIGDKVRQAERLRERARRLESEFRRAVTVAIPSSSSIAGKTSRVATGELGRNLNPGAYTPDRRAVRAAIRGAGGRSLDTLADVESPTTDSYPSTAPYLGLDAIDSATCALKPSTALAEEVAGTARLLREGPALSRLRPYLNKVTYIPPTLAGGIGSTELLLVRPKAGVDGWFLYGVLKLESSIRQLNPVATGSTHPRVDREDVLDLLVPWRDEHDALGAKLRTAQACYSASTALTATATTLVEHLIDGRMTEADLVAAQKALEAGDRSADRENLRGFRQSDAPDAKPLIADVDALYALLDEPEGQDA